MAFARRIMVAPALLLMSAASVQSQAIEVDGTRLQPGLDSLAIFLIRGGDTIPTGMVWDELVAESNAPGGVLFRVYSSQDQVLGERLDSITSRLPTLEPISYRSLTSSTNQSIEYSDRGAVGWVTMVTGDTIEIAAPLPNTVYAAESFDLVLRSLDLKDGLEVAVPTFVSTSRAVMMMNARVVGSEFIGAADSWIVEAEFGGTPVTFWISKDTRRLTRQEMHVQEGVSILFAAPPPVRAPARSG